MRGRLMAYAHGFRGAKRLRHQFSTLSTMAELEATAAAFLSGRSPWNDDPEPAGALATG
jgi:hypothetical protein